MSMRIMLQASRWLISGWKYALRSGHTSLDKALGTSRKTLREKMKRLAISL